MNIYRITFGNSRTTLIAADSRACAIRQAEHDYPNELAIKAVDVTWGDKEEPERIYVTDNIGID